MLRAFGVEGSAIGRPASEPRGTVSPGRVSSVGISFFLGRALIRRRPDTCRMQTERLAMRRRSTAGKDGPFTALARAAPRDDVPAPRAHGRRRDQREAPRRAFHVGRSAAHVRPRRDRQHLRRRASAKAPVRGRRILAVHSATPGAHRLRSPRRDPRATAAPCHARELPHRPQKPSTQPRESALTAPTKLVGLIDGRDRGMAAGGASTALERRDVLGIIVRDRTVPHVVDQYV